MVENEFQRLTFVEAQIREYLSKYRPAHVRIYIPKGFSGLADDSNGVELPRNYITVDLESREASLLCLLMLRCVSGLDRFDPIYRRKDGIPSSRESYILRSPSLLVGSCRKVIKGIVDDAPNAKISEIEITSQV